MSVAEGLAVTYLKIGVLGAVIIVAILLLVRTIEKRAIARQEMERRTGTAGDDGVPR